MDRFIKLRDLDGKQFTIKGIQGFSYKTWDNDNRRMLSSDTPLKGYSKRWSINTDKGRLEVSQNQMGKILECLLNDGNVSTLGKTIAVKGNGREGLQADFYFNPVHEDYTEPEEESPDFEY